MGRPSGGEVAATAEKTKAALKKITNGKTKSAQPKHVPDSQGKTAFIRYTRGQQGGSDGLKQRIIKVSDANTPSSPVQPTNPFERMSLGYHHPYSLGYHSPMPGFFVVHVQIPKQLYQTHHLHSHPPYPLTRYETLHDTPPTPTVRWHACFQLILPGRSRIEFLIPGLLPPIPGSPPPLTSFQCAHHPPDPSFAPTALILREISAPFVVNLYSRVRTRRLRPHPSNS